MGSRTSTITCMMNRWMDEQVDGLTGRWRCAPPASFCSSSPQDGKAPPSMLKHLSSKIRSTGPISVSEYMKEVLTNPVTGYYVRKMMLGAEGDFITSPEISQVFGELLGVWIVSEWMGAGRTSQLQLVELGPGKGSLTADILRVFSQLRSVVGGASVSVHLVEVSPVLSRVQAETLTGTGSQEASGEDEPVYRRGETAAGVPVSWYRRLEDVPAGFSIFVAHEFFDALPVHKFQRTEKGWREVLVDIDPADPDRLRFVVAPSPTLASATLVQPDERRDHVEVCAEGGVIVQELARRIQEEGGAALIADYGHDGTKTDTLRGFKGHRLHDVLSAPGSADLTADVDFSFLRRMAGGGVACLGPVTQRTFLKNMGIDARMQVLLRSCSDPPTRRQLLSSYDVLTGPSHMGERFLFLGLLRAGRLAPPQEAAGPEAGEEERGAAARGRLHPAQLLLTRSPGRNRNRARRHPEGQSAAPEEEGLGALLVPVWISCSISPGVTWARCDGAAGERTPDRLQPHRPVFPVQLYCSEQEIFCYKSIKVLRLASDLVRNRKQQLGSSGKLRGSEGNILPGAAGLAPSSGRLKQLWFPGRFFL
ncbi:protein arginine methyltransferase NDUFAF7, mitochondrial isoform 2-T2 [Anableps anableps]